MQDQSLQGKTIFLTGATNGIGKETALQLARLGATLACTTRNQSKGEAVRSEIIHATSNTDIHMLPCDLGSFTSIRACITRFHDQFTSLDVLINDAGVFHGHRHVTSDGIEATFAINYLAPFLLSHLLLPDLQKPASARIINVTSGYHHGTINFENIEYRENYSGWEAYRQSKLALIIFTKTLALKLKDTAITVNCINPKMTKTTISREAKLSFRLYMKFRGRPPQTSARYLVNLAANPALAKTTGQYFVDKNISQPSATIDDPDIMQQLWKVSEEYVDTYR